MKTISTKITSDEELANAFWWVHPQMRIYAAMRCRHGFAVPKKWWRDKLGPYGLPPSLVIQIYNTSPFLQALMKRG